MQQRQQPEPRFSCGVLRRRTYDKDGDALGEASFFPTEIRFDQLDPKGIPLSTLEAIVGAESDWEEATPTISMYVVQASPDGQKPDMLGLLLNFNGVENPEIEARRRTANCLVFDIKAGVSGPLMDSVTKQASAVFPDASQDELWVRPFQAPEGGGVMVTHQT